MTFLEYLIKTASYQRYRSMVQGSVFLLRQALVSLAKAWQPRMVEGGVACAIQPCSCFYPRARARRNIRRRTPRPARMSMLRPYRRCRAWLVLRTTMSLRTRRPRDPIHALRPCRRPIPRTVTCLTLRRFMRGRMCGVRLRAPGSTRIIPAAEERSKRFIASARRCRTSIRLHCCPVK